MLQDWLANEPPFVDDVGGATPEHHPTSGGSLVLNRNVDKSDIHCSFGLCIAALGRFRGVAKTSHGSAHWAGKRLDRAESRWLSQIR